MSSTQLRVCLCTSLGSRTPDKQFGQHSSESGCLRREPRKGANADAARVRALAAYKDFLTLWKDADTDIPILKQAKAEYGKLQ
jgi:hypothetical protein